MRCVGGFVLNEVIGRGGLGIVYRGQRLSDGKPVAVKLVGGMLHRPDGGDGSVRLLREALALSAVQHEYVVDVFAAGKDAGHVYLAMELIDGITLKAWQRDESRTVREIVDQYVRVGSGLAAAHEVGLIHRDFKPTNVMIGNDGRPRVLDFGLVRREPSADVRSDDDDAWEEITQVGITLGTPNYMAPEQVRGELVDSRSDQFSFCIALYEAVTREHPFFGQGAEPIMRAIKNDLRRAWPSTADVPDLLLRILDRGLSPDPARRFGSMEQLVAALRGGLWHL
jgi:serine/threonine-protein kinase